MLGGSIIFVAYVCLAVWAYSNARRTEQVNLIKAASDAEKAALILKNDRDATRAERELVSVLLRG